MNWYKTASFSQDSWEYNFGDYQRWVVDGYEVKVFMTSMPRQHTVSMQVYNWNNGSMRFQQFWRYDGDAKSECKDMYDKVVTACKEVVDIFTNGEGEQAPNVLIVSYLRKRTLELDRNAVAKTNIPHINYALDKAEYGEDWRQNLYGNRYPTGDTTGF
jgi:hypothetical protein